MPRFHSLSRRRRARSMQVMPLYRPVSDLGVARLVSRCNLMGESLTFPAGAKQSPVVLFHPFGPFEFGYPGPHTMYENCMSLFHHDERMVLFFRMYKFFRLRSIEFVVRFPFGSGGEVGEFYTFPGVPHQFCVFHKVDRWVRDEDQAYQFLGLADSVMRNDPSVSCTSARNIGDVLEFRYDLVATGYRESLWCPTKLKNHLGAIGVAAFMYDYDAGSSPGVPGFSPGFGFILVSSYATSGAKEDLTVPYQISWNAVFEFKDFVDNS